eukprot:561597-Pyramimonas_sp.AAC.1
MHANARRPMRRNRTTKRTSERAVSTDCVRGGGRCRTAEHARDRALYPNILPQGFLHEGPVEKRILNAQLDPQEEPGQHEVLSA